MKRPLNDKRPFGPFVSLETSGSEHETPCEIALMFEEHIADMMIATERIGAEHASLFYKIDGKWHNTPSIIGEEKMVDRSTLRTLQGGKIERSDNHYFIHTHPEEGPGKASNMSFGDISTVVNADGEKGQSMSAARISSNEVAIKSLWRHKTMPKNKEKEYEALFNQLFPKQGEEPEVLNEMVEFLNPHYRFCETVIEYPEPLEKVTTLNI